MKQHLENRAKLNISLKTNERLDQDIDSLNIDMQDADRENTNPIKRGTIGNNYLIAIRNIVAKKEKEENKLKELKTN